MSDESTKKTNEHVDPDEDSLREMPEVSDPRFRRRPGQGQHTARSVGEIVTIDSDLWPHFGSQRAVNEALRRLLERSSES